MKKYILVALLVAFAAGLMAQTGIYGIYFGQKLTDADKELKQQGFAESRRLDTNIYYTNSSIPNLEELFLYYSSAAPDAVYYWRAVYNVDETEASEAAIVKLVEDIHGQCDVQDDYHEEYIWYLENGHAIYVYYNGEGQLVIEYNDVDY